MVLDPDIELLTRLFELEGDRLSPEKARLVLSMGFSQHDHERVTMLGEKANDGTLSPAEREQYESYIRVSDLLSILQSKARLTLRKTGMTA